MGPPEARRAGGGKGRTEMSSWIGGLNADPYRRPGGGLSGNEVRTTCKLGRHAILKDDPARWVSDSRLAPMGLSCVPCLKAKAAELGLEVPAEPAAMKVPAQKVRQVPPKVQWKHGSASTYQNYGCRCDPCKKANSERSAKYRAARRGRKAAQP